MNEDIRLLHGDCLELLKAIPAHSIDAIVMDPPFQVTGRKFVGMELHKGYYDQAVERVRGALAQKELPL